MQQLLVIDASVSRHLALTKQPYSILVAGIYSSKPGMLGSTRTVDEPAAKDEVPLAVVGIVPYRVTAENGAIQVGDLLVTSSTPGHAMKGTDRGRLVVASSALESTPALWSAKTPCDFKISKIQEGHVTRVHESGRWEILELLIRTAHAIIAADFTASSIARSKCTSCFTHARCFKLLG